jgi:hypothetical protein
LSRRFTTKWISLRGADRFIAKHHRHHVPAQGGIVALGLWEGERLVGVGMLGRPVSRELQAQGVVEMTRLCVLEDCRHAASALLGRMRRAAQALGFTRLVTYTLPEEGGASLRANAWQADMELVGGGEWTTPSRPRNGALHPIERKARWWAGLKAQTELDL